MKAVVGRVRAEIVQRTPSGKQAPETKIKPFPSSQKSRESDLLKSKEKKHTHTNTSLYSHHHNYFLSSFYKVYHLHRKFFDKTIASSCKIQNITVFMNTSPCCAHILEMLNVLVI